MPTPADYERSLQNLLKYQNELNRRLARLQAENRRLRAQLAGAQVEPPRPVYYRHWNGAGWVEYGGN